MNNNTLSYINHHDRDNMIKFYENTHTYKIIGDENEYTSVTTWVHTHFKPFNANDIINKMISSKNWNTNKYYGKNKNEIIKEWDENRQKSANEGTKLHYDIECYYNNVITPTINQSLEYYYFLQFANDYKNLKPYRTEWMIWDSDVKIAGSIDMAFTEYENNDKYLLLYDWKRCKEITKISKYNEYAITENINYLPDSNFWHYSLQLNTYKYILEKNYNKIVNGLYLVCLHPNNKNNSYIRMQCADLQKEVIELFDNKTKNNI